MNEMSKQMELFDEGGLMQEGGTVDPISGNDVPVGSTQEEVRDDIPAQLSEGEFVMPADVVRYHGLDKMMALRDEAKMGLQRMDDMGQMGNSEEAIIPDGVPFGMDDLEIEDDGLEMAQGGVVRMANGGPVGQIGTPSLANTAPAGTLGTPIGQVGPNIQAGTQVVVYGPDGTAYGNAAIAQAAGVTNYTMTPPAGQTSQPTPTTGQATAPVQAASAQFQPAGTKFTPTTTQKVMPTFKETIGLGVPYVDYDPTSEEETEEEVDSPLVDTTTTTTQSPQGDGGDSRDYGGGTSLLTGEKIAGYSPEEIKSGVASAKDRYAITGSRGFDLLNVIPGGTFIKSLMPDSVSATVFGKDPTIPEDASVPPGIGMPVSAMQARNALEQSIGTKITGYVGFQKGDLDPNSGGFFDKNGIAVDPRTGDQSRNESGTMNYASFSDFKKAFSAGSESGWRGGKLGAKSYSNLSAAAKSKYNKFASIMGYTDHREMSTTERAKNKNEAAKKEAVEQARRASLEREMRQSGMLAERGLASDPSGKVSGGASQAAADAARAAPGYGGRPGGVQSDGSYNDAGFQGGGNDDNPGGGTAGSDSGSAQGGGYGGGTDCLTEDMKVKLNGVVDFVTNVKVGDMIDSYRVKEVLHKHMRSGYYAINNELKISNDHPVLANGTWTRPEDLVVGDNINGIPVSSLEYVERMTPTVSIVIDGESFDVHTKNNIYTVHGRYREVRQEAA